MSRLDACCCCVELDISQSRVVCVKAHHSITARVITQKAHDDTQVLGDAR